MSQKLSEVIGRIGRRGFLGKLSAAATALMISLMGSSQSGFAFVRVKCCNLCTQDSGQCGGFLCQWEWTCCYQGQLVQCVEAYNNPLICGDPPPAACESVLCSAAPDLGFGCP